MRLLLLFLALTSLSRADSLASLKERLQALKSDAPVAAEVTFTKLPVGKTEKPETPFSTKYRVTDDANGLSFSIANDLLTALHDEQVEETKDPNREQPIGAGLSEIRVQTLRDFLHASDAIELILSQSTLEKEEPTTYQGREARLLSFKVTPLMDEKGKKYLKEFSLSYKLWTAPDYTPLAAEKKMHLKGRAMLVITFEQDETETFDLQVVNGRLVISRNLREGSGSGGGESNRYKKETTLAFLKA